MRFKLDENLPRRVATLLVDLGHDCSTAIAEDLVGASDARVAAAATHENRVLMTLDRGFADIRANPPGTHPGIVVIHTPDQRPGAIEGLVRTVMLERLLEQTERSTVIVEPGRLRIRRPPTGEIDA